MSPVPVLASSSESEVADTYLRTSHVVSDLSERTSSYACAMVGSERRSLADGILVVDLCGVGIRSEDGVRARRWILECGAG